MGDKFAEIAKTKSNRSDCLIEPQPIPFSEKLCVLNKCKLKPEKTHKKISTKEELSQVLEHYREQYAPFLKNLAPELNGCNTRIDVKRFMRDGKNVTIPDYGGPVGYEFTEYTADVEIGDFDGKAVYLHFDGADYITTVYLNGECVGIHEGFFSSFEYDVTRVAKKGINKLRIVLQNDFVYMGGSLTADEAVTVEGDKLYAATGLGYDDPELGWHHCPAGMGIYNSVYFEIRNKVNITDLYVRPLLETDEAEVWIEVDNCDHDYRDIEFELSLYGQNFESTVFENRKYLPWFAYLSENDTKKSMVNKYEAENSIEGVRLNAKFGKNVYRYKFRIDNYKLWEIDSPYLYQLQVKLLCDGVLCDTSKQHFGMRSFVQDTEDMPKGMFYLNGKKLRLRGANTMGFEQQDVLRADYSSLIDDILLAKICNMNFWRLTQRPVQNEVYDFCDKLGLLTQTDLPLFAVMRRSKIPEGIRQSEEMIRLVRKHPCNVVVSYINEPCPEARDSWQRHLDRQELERFFTACDMVLKINCPECVIKHVDGDYDPPSFDTMPDNHCYTLWYHNHGLQFRKLHKGYWQRVADGWYYGCGEYGAEGLDFKEIMDTEYPKEWIKEPFSPDNILIAQSGRMQHDLFDKPDSMEGWISATQAHQAFSARFMTEAFRRDPRMVSHAIHLFIDAWPNGWMKAIMDCKRNPKPAYFAYRNALEPIMVSLRSDRFAYYSGETAKIEAYICNDTVNSIRDGRLVFELYSGNKLLLSGEQSVGCDASTSEYCVSASFEIPDVCDRQMLCLKAIFFDSGGNEITYNIWEFEAFADVEVKKNNNVIFYENLEPGEHIIADEKITVNQVDGKIYVSAQTEHEAVKGFMPNDFRFWYDKNTDMISVLTNKTFTADGFTPIIKAWNPEEQEEQAVVAEKRVGNKVYIISQLNIQCENPVAKRFLNNLYKLGE